MAVDAPLCECHGEAMYWQKDRRCKAGGWWECQVKRQQFNATRQTDPERNARICQARRDRYDADPVYRIGGNLRKQARKRAKTLQRLREAVHGEVSPEGSC